MIAIFLLDNSSKSVAKNLCIEFVSQQSTGTKSMCGLYYPITVTYLINHIICKTYVEYKS